MVAVSISFKKRFYRLLQAVLEGRVVPFVGAGFNATAKSGTCTEFEPSVSYLNERLKKFIDER